MMIRDDIADQIIVTWDRVGYYSAQDNLLNYFQLVFRGPNYPIPSGEGRIGFFYKEMVWESGAVSTTAATGVGDGDGRSSVITGSNELGLYKSE